MNDDKEFAGGVALVGFFDPATMAEFMAPEAAAQIAGIRSSPGVPIHRLAAGLVSRGIRTTIVGGVRGAVSIHVKSSPLSIAIYAKRGGWPFLLNGLRRERNAILALLHEIQPSIVHAHWTFEGGRAVGDWDGPKLLTLHDAAWEYARLAGPYNPASAAYIGRWLMNTDATIARFPHIVAESPYVETYLRMRYRYRGEVRVIPSAVADLPDNLTVPTLFPKTGGITFGCYGSPGGVKNVQVALAAFCKLEPSIGGARLLVFGGGWERAGAEFSKRHIEFRGPLPHNMFLQSLVNEVDIWVHPSKSEAQSLVICEAIQVGCLVIAGKQSGAVPWTLDYGRAGLLVDIDDADEVARAMRTAVLERPTFNVMIDYGRRLIQRRFNMEHILDLHLDYYRDIIRDYSDRRVKVKASTKLAPSS